MRDARDARMGLERIAALFALFLVLGPLIVQRIGHPGVLHRGTGTSTFFEQYRRHEPVFLALMAAFAIGAVLLARRAAPGDDAMRSMWPEVSRWGPGRLALAAVLVFAITSAGTWAVMHALPLSMDEYVAGFQSRIFASGRIAVALPNDWKQFGRALTPVFVGYDDERQIWLSGYWPVYGALRALFLRIGAERLVNPMLAGLSVLLVYAGARRLWPDDKLRAWLAVGFLASSSQFLFMSMTGYAMPAHMAFNLLWIYAFSRNDRAGWLAAPLIGVAALGLHNPFPHALFVAPFLLHLLAQRRWRWTAYFGVVYLAGIALWYAWGQAVWVATTRATFTGLFTFPGPLMLAVQQLSLTVILSWQTPLLAVLLIWTALAWRSLSDMERCLVAGVGLSFLFYFLFPTTQGHGWGYRYTYSVLGNMALLGASGVALMSKALGRVVVQRLLVASALLTVFVQWPIRAWQIEGYVRPFARMHEYVASIDADVVIVDPTTSWYGIDLIRNDPFLRQTPKVLSAFNLRPADKQALAERFGDRVHMLEPEEIAQFGIPTFPSMFKQPIWPPR